MRTATKTSLVLSLAVIVGVVWSWMHLQGPAPQPGTAPASQSERSTRSEWTISAVSAEAKMKQPPSFPWRVVRSARPRSFTETSDARPATVKAFSETAPRQAKAAAREAGLRAQSEGATDAAPSKAETKRFRWRRRSTPSPIEYPLAFGADFSHVNLDALGLSESQKRAVAQVQQQFVDAVGGLNQNPKDPAYLKRWQSAQQSANDQLRGILGSQAYLGYELQVYYHNFKSRIESSGGAPLTIDPDELSQVK